MDKNDTDKVVELDKQEAEQVVGGKNASHPSHPPAHPEPNPSRGGYNYPAKM